MAEHQVLQTEISDLVNILSLIVNRGLPIEGDGLDSQLAYEADETEFEHPITNNIANDQDIIKRRALDRLAEMLARFKTDSISRSRKKQNPKNNPAKHVASVVLVCEARTRVATLFCAKNEGMDTADERFLKQLEPLLEKTEAGASERRDGTQILGLDRIFRLLFLHQQPRVSAYIDTIRNRLRQNFQEQEIPIGELTAENLQRVDVAKNIYWQDDSEWCFTIGRSGADEKSLAEDVAISSGDNEENVCNFEICSDILRRLQHLSVETAPADVQALLGKVHRIVLGPRYRPLLKRHLRETIGSSNSKLFKEVWDALLYLIRIFDAAAALSKFAELPDMTVKRLVSVPASVAFEQQQHMDRRTPIQALQLLGHGLIAPPWHAFFQSTKKMEEFRTRAQLSKNTHSEVQLIHHIESHIKVGKIGEDDVLEVFPYMGCSKKCCFFCNEYRAAHGTFEARGSHQTLFPRWSLPRDLEACTLPILNEFSQRLQKRLSALLSLPGPPLKGYLLRQSTAALSTA